MVTERLNKLFKLGDSLYGLRDIFENNGDRISDYFDPAIHWETALSQLPNMNKLGANELLSYACETIPKTKRFSSLTQIELSSLWKDTTSYICQQVSAKKAINLPGVGAFYIRKYKLATGDITETSVPCFIPAKAWEKVPGYKVNQAQLTGSNAAEPMNYAAVASISGFSRDDVETGLKDIVHALFLILKRGSNVSLGFPEMGRLVFYNRDIKFNFTGDFLEVVAQGPQRNPDPGPAVKPSVTREHKRDNAHKDEAKQLAAPAPAAAAANTTTSVFTEKPPPAVPEEIVVDAHADDARVEEMHEEPVKELKTDASAATHDKNLGNGHAAVASVEMAAVDPKQAEMDEIERLAILLTTRAETHTHPHAGNRLWSNDKCPICRQKNSTFIEVKEALDAKEKTQDKMLLLLSLEVDREFLKQTKDVDKKKVKAAVTTAQYNYAEAQKQETLRNINKKNLPFGNIFENRDPGPDRVLQAKELRAGLYDQMTIKRCRKLRETRQKDQEDRELNERLLKEFKTAEVQSHFDKLRRRQQAQEALTEQMATQDLARRREAILEPMTENCFARSESLMFLYQKEKAKQLYQEQLAILKQRREYENKVADMEKQHSLDRLAVSRKELQKDIQSIKQSNFMMRKGLESTWAVQKVQRDQAQAALGY